MKEANDRKIAGPGRRWLTSFAELDPVVFRCLCVASGALTLAAVATYLPWAEAYLTAPFPLRNRGWGTLFALVEHPVWTYGLFILATVAGVSLMLGRWVRVSAAFLLLFCAGLVTAARPLTSSAVGVMCLLYFWLMLMPPSHGTPPRLRGLAVAGLRVQVVLIYGCGVVFKLFDPSWNAGYPLAGALVGHSWESALGQWVGRSVPVEILRGAAWGVMGVEMIAPLALLSSPKAVRRAGVAALSLLHLGMWLLMKLELFPMVMLTVLVVFWDEAMVEGGRNAGQLCRRAGRWVREGLAAVALLLSVAVAVNQVVLPRLGWADWGRPLTTLVRPLNDTLRYDQRWALFTTSMTAPAPDRAHPKKIYRATRLLVKTDAGALFDPFLGRASGVEESLRLGHRHPGVARKALSYLQKQSGSWQERHLRTLGVWAGGRARRAGWVPQAVFVYRYEIPVDFSRSVRDPFANASAVARLWVRMDLDAEGSIQGELATFGPRETSPLTIKLSSSK